MGLKKSTASAWPDHAGFGTMLLVLFAVLSLIFLGLYQPGRILFSNDGPLGRLMSDCHQLPGRFTGCWEDLNSIGMSAWAAPPNISYGLQLLLGPFWFSKFYALLSLLILGLGAWCFFRQWGLSAVACILGGLAAALNSGFFSVACWGVAAHTITVGMSFFALAALADTASPWRWLRVMLAGFAIGMGVSEGADVGAIFSLLIAAFAFYHLLISDGPRARNVAVGLGRISLLALCAVVLAAQAIAGLVSTDIKGVVGMKQDAQTRAQRWNWATQWSLPKRELLGLAVPGLFGYRMDSKDGASYWGLVGRDHAWDDYNANGGQGPPPKGYKRFSGGGSYAGLLVLLIAIWAAVQSLRRQYSVFSLARRKLLWFWLAVSLVSLLLALGRFAPFYRLLYALPYFSTMRNPVKFLDLFGFAVVVLFAFGVDALWRRYMQPIPAPTDRRWPGLSAWWAGAPSFDKRWVKACFLLLALSLFAWLVYATDRPSFERYLNSVQIQESIVPATAAFSIRQVGWFQLFFVLSAALLALILSGAFAAPRATWGALFLGVLLVADLGQANLPWIIYWDAARKYATNPIIDELRDRPFEHRVALVPFTPPPQEAFFNTLYQVGWLPHLFSFYNIQALDLVQMPRLTEDLDAFEKAFNPHSDFDLSHLVTRLWQLTNTRYLLGPARFEGPLNHRFDLANRPLHIIDRFSVRARPGIYRPDSVDDVTAERDPSGPYAIFEFTEALPRAKLYSTWVVNTNANATLALLTSPSFDPLQTVLVGRDLPPTVPVYGTNQNTGSVDFVSYDPKHITLKSHSPAPSILLLNDHFDPHWTVRVDGALRTLLRCNYLMRGVYLEAGDHTIDFHFRPPRGPLYISLAALAIGLSLLGVLVAGQRLSSARTPARVAAQPPLPAGPRRHASPQPAPRGEDAAAARSIKTPRLAPRPRLQTKSKIR